MGGMTQTVLSAGNIVLPDTAQIVPYSAFGEDVFSIAGDQIEQFVWAEGEVLTASPLSVREGGFGRPVTSLAAGPSIGQAAGVLNNRAYFNLPGGALQQLRALYSMPASYTKFIVCRAPPALTSLYALLSGAVGTVFRDRVGDGTIVIAHGGASVTASGQYSAGQDVVIWVSYEAADGTVHIGCNSYAARFTAALAAVPASTLVDYGGYASGGASTNPYPAPVALWAILNGSLHGSNTKIGRRQSLVQALADYYGLAVA